MSVKFNDAFRKIKVGTIVTSCIFRGKTTSFLTSFALFDIVGHLFYINKWNKKWEIRHVFPLLLTSHVWMYSTFVSSSFVDESEKTDFLPPKKTHLLKLANNIPFYPHKISFTFLSSHLRNFISFVLVSNMHNRTAHKKYRQSKKKNLKTFFRTFF